MLGEVLGAVPWWGFALGGVGSAAFGLLQVHLMRRAMEGGKPKPWFFAVKLLLWAILLVGLGLLSIPLLLLGVLVASAAMLVGNVALYRRAQKKEVK